MSVAFASLEDVEAGRYGPAIGEAVSPAPALQWFLASELAEEPPPPREWNVAGIIPSRTVTLISGDGGTGKSLLALQLAAATAAGEPWLGLETKKGPAVYLSAEDDRDEIHRRLCDIAAADGLDLGALDQLIIVPLAGEDAVLAAPGARGGLIVPTPLWASFRSTARLAEPALIVLDTSADLFGGDENIRAQVRQFVGMLRGLAIETGAAVVLLSHPSVSGMSSGSGTSGSTAWSNSCRSRLYLTRTKDEAGIEIDPDARTLTTMKANHTRTGGEIRLKWRDGVFVAQDEPELHGMQGMAAAARAERIFLELLDAYNSDGRGVSPRPSPNFAPAVFARDPRADGLTKKALTSAMNYLFQSAQIATEESGPSSRRRQTIVRAATGRLPD